MAQMWESDNDIILKSQLELESLEGIKQAVQLGESISFISLMAVQKEVDLRELYYSQIPQQTIKKSIYLAYNRDRWLTQWLRVFMTKIKEETSLLQLTLKTFISCILSW